MERHVRQGERLLNEREDRYQFWVLTDCDLPGEDCFDKRCSDFDERARRKNWPTLEEIQQINTIFD